MPNFFSKEVKKVDHPRKDGLIGRLKKYGTPKQNDNNLEYKPLEHQIALIEGMKDSYLKDQRVVHNMSKTGAGKTFMTLFFLLYVIQDRLEHGLETTVGVVCPGAVTNSWASILDDFDVSYKFIKTYTSLSNKDSKLFKEETRLVDLSDGHTVSKQLHTTLYPQSEENVSFLIIDESQNIKNPSRQSVLTRRLMNDVLVNGGVTVLLSATPFDKTSHLSFFMWTLGLTYNNLYSTTGKFGHNPKMTPVGFEKIARKAHQRFPELEIDDLLESRLKLDRKMIELCTRLNNKIIFRSNFDNARMFKYARNVLYQPAEEYIDEIRQQLRLFAIELANIKGGSSYLAYYKKVNEWLEEIKVELIVDSVLNDINSGRKVVAFITHKKSQEKLKSMLEEEGCDVIIVNGDIKDRNKRTEYINHFNSDSTEPMCLIVSPLVVGFGVDLDDKTGKYPRTSYIFSSFLAISMIQCCGRIVRANTYMDPNADPNDNRSKIPIPIIVRIGSTDKDLLEFHTMEQNLERNTDSKNKIISEITDNGAVLFNEFEMYRFVVKNDFEYYFQHIPKVELLSENLQKTLTI